METKKKVRVLKNHLDIQYSSSRGEMESIISFRKVKALVYSLYK